MVHFNIRIGFNIHIGSVDGSLMAPNSETNVELKLPNTLAYNTICVVGILTWTNKTKPNIIQKINIDPAKSGLEDEFPLNSGYFICFKD